MLGKEMGYEISTRQMQYDANIKERDQKVHASYALEGTVLDNVENSNFIGSLSQMICDGIHMSAIFALRLIRPVASSS